MHNNHFLSIEVNIKPSMVSIHWCILKPYLLVCYYRINFYWGFLNEKAEHDFK